MNDYPQQLSPVVQPTSPTTQPRQPFRWLLMFVAAVFVFIAGAVVGVVADDPVVQTGGTAQETPAATAESVLPSVIDEAWALVHNRYVDTDAIDDNVLAAGAIRGMLEALGDEGHTRYLSPEEVTRHEQSLSGSYVGVGIRVEERDEQIIVITPLDDSPAQRAGIQPGDILVAIDGESIEGLTLIEVVQKVRGEEGSTVNLTFIRPDQSEPFNVTLERTQLRNNPVAWTMLPNGIAVIRLGEFTTGAAAQLEQAIRAAQQAEAHGIVLDLRNNPGGLVNEAIDVASLFLDEDTPIFISQSRDGEHEIHRARKGFKTDLPLVVLVNGGSASSAEIVAGALQDNDRATVVGETTFGTGTVLNQFPLSDGSAVLLGVELWLTPSGELIRGQGITPDMQVELAENQRPYFPRQGNQLLTEIPDDSQLERGVSILQEAIRQLDALRPAA